MYDIAKLLVDLLDHEGINYCHWKSNLLLNDALDGHDDLDFLVSRKDIAKFEAAILSIGFKGASNSHIGFSGIKHFYGYDQSSGELLHLHVYYQIKTGPSWTKSIRFDFESRILAGAVRHESGVKVPEQHIELILFVFRVMLKYSKVNELVLVEREKKRTLIEIDYLLLNLDEQKLQEFLDEYFSNISKKEFYDYIRIIQFGSISRKYHCGKQLAYKLRKYSYRSLLRGLFLNLSQLFYRVLNKLFFHEKKYLESGGVYIVVAGLDATGKTTVTTELKSWLGKNFTVSLIHFGKPNSSFITYPMNILINFLRLSGNRENLRSSLSAADKSRSITYVIRQLVLAYDRSRLAKKYWNKASAGQIVLCDRYKSENFNVMDSKRLNVSEYSGISKRLARLENSLYENMPKPDLLFYLTVPVDVAVERNRNRVKDGKETAEFIKIRHELNKDLQYKANSMVMIDTNCSYHKVISGIKVTVWACL